MYRRPCCWGSANPEQYVNQEKESNKNEDSKEAVFASAQPRGDFAALRKQKALHFLSSTAIHALRFRDGAVS